MSAESTERGAAGLAASGSPMTRPKATSYVVKHVGTRRPPAKPKVAPMLEREEGCVCPSPPARHTSCLRCRDGRHCAPCRAGVPFGQQALSLGEVD